MNDWLSEIEENLLTLSLPGNEGANMDARKRMARVLRELADVAKSLENAPDEYFEGLSSDARELLY